MIPALTRKGECLVEINPRYLPAEFWDLLTRRGIIDNEREVEAIIIRMAKAKGLNVINDTHVDQPYNDPRLRRLAIEVLPSEWNAEEWIRPYWSEGRLYIRRLTTECPTGYRAVIHVLNVTYLTEELNNRLTPLLRYYVKKYPLLKLHDIVEMWYQYSLAQYYDLHLDLDDRLVDYFEYPNMKQLYRFFCEQLAMIPQSVNVYAFHHLDPAQSSLSLIFQQRRR